MVLNVKYSIDPLSILKKNAIIMEKITNSFAITTIDDYLATVPDDKRLALETLRQIIKEVAPKAEEAISYRMPTFKYHGNLVYFAAFKNHCSLFVGNGSLVDQIKDELKDYSTTKSCIHFTIENPLPAALIKKIVLRRMAQNEEKQRLKYHFILFAVGTILTKCSIKRKHGCVTCKQSLS